MNRVIESREQWCDYLKHEYPGVQFDEDKKYPRGINAITAGVLVGRFYVERTEPYGVVFDQPRSCGGRS